ncbi:toprim domain-containing protein [Campylobacter jejuni]|nr:toprim domain-containing protein [Campylobacter jejuni]EFS0701692.1 toprim domain-containing protein [Campylobacter jejuni]EHS1057425.1 toprim domain-containing protein [Campylobacter jejuni]EHS1059175.1 toprim domain-containing protein [Campylobacter jejuni]EHS1060947.1 toprim domain-containing protein [Campylobacter jejuni]
MSKSKVFNEEILTLPFDIILMQNGYSYKKDKCSRNFITMSNESDLIIITRQTNGQYLYFNPNEENDRGNIYSFCKNRGIKINNLLNEKVDKIELKHNIEPSKSINKASIEAINNYKAFTTIKQKNFFNDDRLISQEILETFNTLKQDKHYNVCVPTYILDNFQGKDFINSSGYIAYLRKPITHDKQGNIYSKPIKQLCYGNKGLEIIRNKDNKQKIENIKTIIITESMIDSLSLFELKNYNPNDTLLCATNGQITKSHKEIFMYFEKNAKNAKIVLGFDNDEKGLDFNLKTKQCFKEREIIEENPKLKDFNDDLLISKVFGLKKNFSLEDIQKEINSLQEKTEYLLDRKSVLIESKKIDLIKGISNNDIPLISYLKPKLENFINLKALEKRFEEFNAYLDRINNKKKGVSLKE